MRKKLLSIFLVLIMVLCLAPVTAFATVIWTDVNSISDLVSAFENGGNIKLTCDLTFTAYQFKNYQISKNVNLDLNGKKITIPYTEEITITNGGALNVFDNSNSENIGSIFFRQNDDYVIRIETGGSLTLNSGTIETDDGNGQIKNNGTFTLNSGILKVRVENYSLFYLNGGSIYIKEQLHFINSKYGTLYANGGIITNTSGYEGSIHNAGKLVVEENKTGTVFECDVKNIYQGTIDGGIFKENVKNDSSSDGVPTITSGTFEGMVTNKGTITGGTYTGTVANSGLIYATANVTGSGSITYDKTAGNVITYKIGENKYAEQFVKTDSTATKPQVDPTQAGYTFDGWYTDPECTKAFDFENTTVATAITLYGKMIECDHTGNTNALSCTEDTICSVCSGTIKAAHLLYWKADATHYWQECYRSGCDYTTVNNKKEIPTIEIKGNDKVHTDQDYSFSFEVPEDSTVVRVEYKIPMTGSFNLKVNAENGIYTGVMSKDNYAGAESFGILVTVKINDGYEFETTKNVKLTDEHEGGTATCNEQAICDICGEPYGEKDQGNHANLKHFSANAATTAKEGNKEYWYCDGCEKYFSDANGTKEITLKDTLIAKLAPAKKTKSPQTGDESNMFLWLALLLVSGGAVTAATIANKNRKYNR